MQYVVPLSALVVEKEQDRLSHLNAKRKKHFKSYEAFSNIPISNVRLPQCRRTVLCILFFSIEEDTA